VIVLFHHHAADEPFSQRIFSTPPASKARKPPVHCRPRTRDLPAVTQRPSLGPGWGCRMQDLHLARRSRWSILGNIHELVVGSMPGPHHGRRRDLPKPGPSVFRFAVIVRHWFL